MRACGYIALLLTWIRTGRGIQNRVRAACCQELLEKLVREKCGLREWGARTPKAMLYRMLSAKRMGSWLTMETCLCRNSCWMAGSGQPSRNTPPLCAHAPVNVKVKVEVKVKVKVNISLAHARSWTTDRLLPVVLRGLSKRCSPRSGLNLKHAF